MGILITLLELVVFLSTPYSKSILPVYPLNNLIWSIVLFTVFFFWGRYFLVSFFGLDEKTYAEAIRYLEIFCLSMIPIFMVPTFSGILNARGNARIPFIANTIGLVVNVILDPIMIFGWFGFPALGIRGAALATVLAQYIVLGIFIYFEWDLIPFLKEKMGQKTLKDILLLGLPTAGQSVLFSAFYQGKKGKLCYICKLKYSGNA